MSCYVLGSFLLSLFPGISVSDIDSKRVIGFVPHLIPFDRYQMHCRESVWEEESYIAFFGGVLWVTHFTCLGCTGSLGISFPVYAGSYILDPATSTCCFPHSFLRSLQESGNKQHVVRTFGVLNSMLS